MYDSVSFPFAKLTPESQYERAQREFLLLQRQEDPRSIDFTTSLKNRHKNRYLDILANEKTIYPPCVASAAAVSSLSSCYVNGNLIDLALPHTFVACQAPVPKGIPDFLTMLYEKKINLVIMITKLVENGVAKADCYWPGEKATTCIKVPSASGLTISNEPGKKYDVDNELGITRRYLILQKPNEPAHKLLHVQYTNWPDHGVPQSSASFEALLDIVNSSSTSAPVVVHCSAGIGRTGTLIGAYGVLGNLERGTLTDTTVYDVVAEMRRQRFGMVQRVEQYFVIYLTLMSRIGVDIKPLVALLNRKAAVATGGASVTVGGDEKKRR